MLPHVIRKKIHDSVVCAEKEDMIMQHITWPAVNNETSVDELERKLSDSTVGRQDIIAFLKQLANAGFGNFKNGRRGRPSRFVWSKGIERAAAGSVATRGNRVDTLGHEYRLRPDYVVRLELPADLTPREARRLGDFVSTLSFSGDEDADLR